MSIVAGFSGQVMFDHEALSSKYQLPPLGKFTMTFATGSFTDWDQVAELMRKALRLRAEQRRFDPRRLPE